MTVIKAETHELGTIEGVVVRVDIWENGDVDIQVGDAALTPQNLTDIVAFVEHHGRIQVVEHDA